MRRWIGLAALLAIALHLADRCAADTIAAKYVEQTFESRPDTDASMCTLLTHIVNLPAPEAVNFRFSLAESNKNKDIFSVFNVDVADFIFENGATAGTKKVKLTDANISASDFSTSGVYNVTVLEDGGVMGSTRDPNAGGRLLGTIMSADFNITFQRYGDPTTRTYNVRAHPSREELQKFSACSTRLLGTE